MGQLVFQATLGGQVNLIGPNTASTFNINVPATSGNMVTTGDTATVTTTMLASTTGSGAVVLATSPTLVTPALGTPSALVGTNITGTAAGLSIGGNAATATTATNVSGGTSSVTSETVSGNLTLSGGTANGVAYLNGSKVVTTGSALVFDGTNLGLGVTPSGAKLDISGSGTQNLRVASTSGNAQLILNSSGANVSYISYGQTGANPLAFYDSNAAAERMRLDTSGNLGIGTSSPLTKLQIGSGGGTGVKDVFYIGSYSTDTSQFRLLWNHVGSGTLGIGTANDTSGSMIFGRASDTAGTVGAEWMRLDTSGNLGLGVTPSAWGVGSNGHAFELSNAGALWNYSSSTGVNLSQNIYYNGAYYYKNTAAASLYGQGSGQHQWFNAPSGTAGTAATLTQAMTLDASGNLLVGTTSFSYNPTQGATIAGGTVGSIGIGHASGTTSGNGYANFTYNGTNIGSITQSGTTAVLYNVTSDQRLKTNIADAPEFGSVIDSMQVRSYDWKSDGNHQRAGFIAQELVTVAPEAVHQPADPEEMMAVDYSKLVPMLVKEIQSLRARVAQLESK